MRTRITILVTCVFSILQIVKAQEITDIYSIPLDSLWNIKVTTPSKSEEQFFMAPASMNIITAKEIKSYGALNLLEVLDRVTSMYGLSTIVFPDGILAVRGTVTPHYNTHLLILLNGSPLRESVNNGANSLIYKIFPLESIKKIEIIRGTGSVLYGSNAYTAVIHIITKDATEKLEASTRIRYGSFDSWQTSLMISKKINKISLKANVVWNKTNGWDFTARGENDMEFIDDVETVVNPPRTMQMDHTDKSLLLEAKYKGFKAHFLGLQSNFEYMSGGARWGNPLGNRIDLSQYFASLAYDKKWNNKWALNIHADFNKTLRDQPSYSLFNPILSTQDGHGFLFEASLALKFSEKIRMIGGTVFNRFFLDNTSYSKTTDGSRFTDFDTQTNTTPFMITDGKSENWYSAYFQFSFEPYNFIHIDLGGQANKTASPVWSFVPRVNVVMHWQNKLYLKLIYGQAFRSPSLLERYNISEIINSYTPPSLSGGGSELEPEKIQTSEIQISYKHKKFLLTATIFQNQEKNLIVRSLPSDSLVYATVGEVGKKLAVPTYINKGSLKTQGVELEGKFNLFRNLSLSLSYSKFWVGDGSSEQTMGMPNSMFKTGIVYEYPSKGFLLGIFNSYYGEGDDIGAKYPNANPHAKSYNFLTANISLNIRKFMGLSPENNPDITIEMYAKNLLNEKIYYPEYIRRNINTIPGRSGRSIYASLIIGI